ncbi:MAG: hypothetical protein P4L33_10460 [Capsulimonadaceae bacterium]|nr:hypothetical protein [Capsulimonadaceae bacterium]
MNSISKIHRNLFAAAILAAFTLLAQPPATADDAGRPIPPSTSTPRPASGSNSTLVEEYIFSAATGESVAGTPGYDDPAKLVGCEWTKPGYKTAAAALRFDGKTSIAWLPATKTPAGPISIKIVLRPTVLGGNVLSDVGGLVIGITPKGAPSAMRHTSTTPWQYIESSATINAGEWAEVEYQWDGATQRLFVNGQLAAEGPCDKGFASGPRALGCNCYGPTSDHYAGDIASLDIHTLKVAP